MEPYRAAKDAGLFKKYGLDIDLVAFPSGTEGRAAMIAGEIEFLAIAGSTTASAAIGGADVVSLAITTERLVVSLVTLPTIQKSEESILEATARIKRDKPFHHRYDDEVFPHQGSRNDGANLRGVGR